jgi:hypothetical protein
MITKENLFKKVTEQHGFLTEAEAAGLAYVGLGNLPVLIRCGTNRFLCPVKEVHQRVKDVDERGDYIRDISVPTAQGGGDRWVREGYKNPYSAF